MTEIKSSSIGKRKVWIALGIAAVAVTAAGIYVLDKSPSSEDVSGTIAPAQRYRSAQAPGADVPVGNQSAPKAIQPGAAPAAANAASNAADNAASRTVQNAASSAASNAANNAASRTVQNAASSAASNAANNAASRTVQNAASGAASNAANNAASSAASNAASRTQQ